MRNPQPWRLWILSAALLPFAGGGRRICEGIVPENGLRIDVSVKKQGISQVEFDEVLDRVERIYAPLVKRVGGKLIISRYWEDGTVNAYAERDGRNYHLRMYGGLARHSLMTRDVFALVACHEVGHHLAGWPRKHLDYWASVEGQADYFAPTKCLRKFFAGEDNARAVGELAVPAIVRDACVRRFGTSEEESLICQRSAMAGHQIAQFFVSIRQGLWANFETPDDGVVKETFISHPMAQCRLDTYFAAARCPVSDREDFDPNRYAPGSCEPHPEWDEARRPACWFYPEDAS